MNPVKRPEAIRKLEVGITGFDQISEGGIPEGRTTMVVGTAGSGKTLLALQFLVEGVRQYEDAGVLVTFEEPGDDLIRNVESLGWDLASLIEQNLIAVVDASERPGEAIVEAGAFDFSALLARIESAIRRVDAKRVILDSVGALFSQFADSNIVRRELHRLAAGMRELGVTVLFTSERPDDYGPISRFGVEEFVADNVVILRNGLEQEKRRRTIEILKFRGVSHQKGEYPFTIDATSGVTIIPLSAMELHQRSSEVRISSGNSELDEMCGGGLFQDSIVLASGATGAGKTLMVTGFMDAGIKAGERSLLFAYEESPEQLFRNAASWGIDLKAAEQTGLFKVVARYPESMSLEDHVVKMKREIAAFEPSRVAVDSLSALERVSTLKSFREFVIGVTSYFKQEEIAGMFTNTTSMLLGGESITEAHISTITDSIILLRYVEILGEMKRGLTVLKMRGSWHQKAIREYTIDAGGMQIQEPFHNVSGILSGSPTCTPLVEKQRLAEMFEPLE